MIIPILANRLKDGLSIFLKVSGWLLIIGAAFILLYSIFAAEFEGHEEIVTTLTGTGIMLALGAQLLTQAKNINDRKEKRSQFFLDSCVEAYEEARKLLQDGNNERGTWIAAGRALIHAKKLADSVSEDTHRLVLEIHQSKYRGCFHDALAKKTAAFFYGAEDASIPTDKAAELSTAGEVEGGTLNVRSTLKWLNEKSLRAVWEAAKWPKDYQEPLGHGFSDEERDSLMVLYPGLYDFFEHKRRYHSASGKLYKR